MIQVLNQKKFNIQKVFISAYIQFNKGFYLFLFP